MIEQLAQKQLDYYNARDIEGFLSVYADDVEVYDQASGELVYKGIDEMRKRYTRRFQDVKLHARLDNRMILGKQAIDYEYVTSSNNPVKAIAIYLAEETLINKVWFIHE